MSLRHRVGRLLGVAKQLSQKRIWRVPGTNVSTMDVNQMLSFLLGRQAPRPLPSPEPQP